MAFDTPVEENWPKREIPQWVHHKGRRDKRDKRRER